MTTNFVTFFNGFVVKKGDDNFQWFCCKKGDNINVIVFLYGGGVAKKVMVTSCHCLFFVFLGLFVTKKVN